MRASHNGPKTSVKDYLGTRISHTGRDGFEDLCVPVEPAKSQAQLIHDVRPGIQEPPEGGHIVHKLDEDGHVVIALAGEPLHLGVDLGGNVELLGTEVHRESVPYRLCSRRPDLGGRSSHSSDIDSARMVIGLDQGKAGKP